jgi:hypothetical protein
MLIKMETSASGGGIFEASLIVGTNSNVFCCFLDKNTKQFVNPTGSTIHLGEYIKTDFTTSPRTFVALKSCHAIILNPNKTITEGNFSVGDVMLSWQQSALTDNSLFGVIVEN